jgi:hypothetical protein
LHTTPSSDLRVAFIKAAQHSNPLHRVEAKLNAIASFLLAQADTGEAE